MFSNKGKLVLAAVVLCCLAAGIQCAPENDGTDSLATRVRRSPQLPFAIPTITDFSNAANNFAGKIPGLGSIPGLSGAGAGAGADGSRPARSVDAESVVARERRDARGGSIPTKSG